MGIFKLLKVMSMIVLVSVTVTVLKRIVVHSCSQG